MRKVLVVCGTTASGKTGFAVEVSKRLGGEVISADCMLVYRGLNIGTAKPTESEKQGIKHYMIDVVSPKDPFSVSDYEQMAYPILQRLQEQSIPTVLCGGTGFYLQSLCFVRSFGSAQKNDAIRAKYEQLADSCGNDALHAVLEKVDPQSAKILHPNDRKRVIRALEIYELTGRKKSDQQDNMIPRIPYLAVAFAYERSVLYDRINRRVVEMLAMGLVDEVRDLLKAGVQENDQCMQGIGYKEVVQYLKNRISHSTMLEIIQKNTRNYAKRQITYFNKFPNLIWLDPDDRNNVERVLELMHE